MSQTGKLIPNLDQQSINLTVLQRIDAFIEEILITPAHVTFYEFNISRSRKDVKGFLFVVKRSTQPRFQFIVMNQRNTENRVENLLGDFKYEVQVPYLLYRNAAQEVNGIWFYNSRECEEVGNLFTRILNEYSKVPPKSKVPSSKSEFKELEAVPSMSVIEGPLEPSSAASAATEGPEDYSFESFFTAATNIGSNASNLANSRQPYHSSAGVRLSSHTPIIVSPPSQTPLIPSLPLSSLPASVAIHETPDPMSSSNRVNNLVKPSSFFTPPSSSSALTAPLISSPLPTEPSLHPLLTPYTADQKNPGINREYEEDICGKLFSHCTETRYLLFMGLLGLITLLSLIVLVLMPGKQEDEIYAPKFQVDSVVLFPFVISSSYLTANWNVEFTIRNEQPSYDDASLFYFKDLEALVYFNNSYISSTSFIGSKFFLEPNTNTLMPVNLAAYSVSLNETLAEAIINQRAAYGALAFTFKMNASLVEYPTGKAQYARNFQMAISCDELSVAFISNPATATLLGGPIPCSSTIV